MILSIIIPVFNVDLYLTECLDSVFSQDLSDCEVITVNDGSTDGSRQILTEYKLRYKNLIILDQENRGLSSARNTGLSNANGEYVYFLDSDDYLMPQAVTYIKCSISSTDAEVIYFNAFADGEKVYIPSFKVDSFSKTGIEFFEDYYKNNGIYPYLNVPIYVYRKTFLSNFNLTFKEGLYHEDVLFSMYVFFYTKSIWACNKSIFNYRRNRAGSICTNMKIKNLTDKSEICRSLDVFFTEHNFTNKYFLNLIFNQYLFTLNQSEIFHFNNKIKMFFNKTDISIMRKGIINDYEYKLWKLASINLTLMNRYYHNKLPPVIIRILNIIFNLTFKLKNIAF